MTRPLVLFLLATLARALLAHGCGEVIRFSIEYLLPGIPPLICVAAGLVVGVTLIEVAGQLFNRRDRPK